MRASRSWPRSSVPNGWFHDGPSRCELKSMSLIGTRHSSGPNATASAINARMTVLATASLCRRKRRQISPAGDARSPRAMPSSIGLAVGAARGEPAIECVGKQVEQDPQAGEHERLLHDNRRIVGENGTDQQRSDSGDAKDLLGD